MVKAEEVLKVEYRNWNWVDGYGL